MLFDLKGLPSESRKMKTEGQHLSRALFDVGTMSKHVRPVLARQKPTVYLVRELPK